MRRKPPPCRHVIDRRPAWVFLSSGQITCKVCGMIAKPSPEGQPLAK